MNRKIQPRFIDGMKYIHLSDLPSTQISMFSGWVQTNRELLSTAAEEMKDAIAYDDYDYWYDYHFLTTQNLDDLL